MTVEKEILENYSVDVSIYDRLDEEIRGRIDYLKNFLRKNKHLRGFVLGISGGVDSALAGTLAARACQELREEGVWAEFWALRLPYGTQKDEKDAAAAAVVDYLRKLSYVRQADIKSAVDAICQAHFDSSRLAGIAGNEPICDMNKGNIKARVRMVFQYSLAFSKRCAVIGTDHNSECIMGFFTKHGDGACDLLVLDGLSKNMIREMLRYLGAPTEVYQKAPTADLEDLNPGKLDDEGFGISYEDLTKFIEGGEVEESVLEKIVLNYESTQHKRLPTPTYMSSEIYTNRSHI